MVPDDMPWAKKSPKKPSKKLAAAVGRKQAFTKMMAASAAEGKKRASKGM